MSSDIQHDLEAAESTTRGILARSFYSTGYYLSYGVVFPCSWVASVLPTNNAACGGLRDGAVAAGAASERVNERICAATSAVADKAGDVYAGAARKVQEKVESVQDAIAERRARRIAQA